MSTPSTPESSTAKYDLTPTLSKYLDLHLMFPLLEFVDGNEQLGYNPADIQRARLALVKPTNMVEYAIEIYQDLEKADAVPKEMEAQKDAVYKQIDAYEKQDTTLQDFFTDLVRSAPADGGCPRAQSSCAAVAWLLWLTDPCFPWLGVLLPAVPTVVV